MNIVMICFLLLTAIAFGMSLFALVEGWTKWIYRGVLAGLFCLFVPVSYSMINLVSGTPRSLVVQNLIPTEDFEATLVSYYLVKGKAIYLWVIIGNNTLPVYLVLPWSDQRAEQLSKADRDAKKAGADVMVKMKGSKSLRSPDDSEPDVFQPAPIPVRPEKPQDETDFKTYQRF